MAVYKNIPVDVMTHDLIKRQAKRNFRGIGAHVQALAEAEEERERQKLSEILTTTPEQPEPQTTK